MSSIANFKKFPPKRGLDIFEPFEDCASKLAASGLTWPPLYTRKWHCIRERQSPNLMRVMQFNLLAEGLSAHPSNIPPFPTCPEGNPISPSECGGFDITADSPTIFDFERYRKWRLLEEITRVEPDLLAVEECDHFADFLEPAMTSLGYEV